MLDLFQDSGDDLQEFDDDSDNDGVHDDKLHSSSESSEGDDDLNSGIKKFYALVFCFGFGAQFVAAFSEVYNRVIEWNIIRRGARTK